MKDTVSQCPIEDAMTLLSGRWPTLLLYYLQQGTKRFGQLQKDSPSISHRMLTRELRRLEAAGIVVRKAYAGYPSRVDYSLSAAGPADFIDPTCERPCRPSLCSRSHVGCARR